MTVAEPDLAQVAWRTWIRLGCPADVAGMAKILAVILPEHDRRQWRKSSRSAANRCCVEAAACPHGDVLVRDSKDPDGPVLSFSREA